MCKYGRFYNRLTGIRNRYNGRVYNFHRDDYFHCHCKCQSFQVGGKCSELAEWDTAPTKLWAYMDNFTLVSTLVLCTKRLLDRIDGNLRWPSMKVKPSKLRSISICRGKISDRKFAIDEEEISTVPEKQ